MTSKPNRLATERREIVCVFPFHALLRRVALDGSAILYRERSDDLTFGIEKLCAQLAIGRRDIHERKLARE